MTRPFPWLAPPPRSWLTRPRRGRAAGRLGPGRPRRGPAGVAPPPVRRPLAGRAGPARLPRPAADPLRPPGRPARRASASWPTAAADVNRLGADPLVLAGRDRRRQLRDPPARAPSLAVRLLTGRAASRFPTDVEQLSGRAARPGLDRRRSCSSTADPHRARRAARRQPRAAEVELELLRRRRGRPRRRPRPAPPAPGAAAPGPQRGPRPPRAAARPPPAGSAPEPARGAASWPASPAAPARSRPGPAAALRRCRRPAPCRR